MTMLEPREFLKTVYLGDRACKTLTVDCWRRELSLEINLISRIRDQSGRWNYYSAEDIVDGRIVIIGVQSMQLEPSGPLPNDLINEIVAKPAGLEGAGEDWLFEISINSVAANGTNTEVVLRVVGRDVYLEDPSRRGLRIRE